jgi:hypothetical protein
VETWRSELRAVFPAGAVDIIVLEKWDQLLLWQLVWRGKPDRPTWLIMSETTAKNGPYWQPAAHKDARGLLRCPTCGELLRTKSGGDGDLLTVEDLEKSRKFCTAEVPTRRLDADGNRTLQVCGAVLWQYTSRERIWAPANYIHKKMKGVFDYLIIDEAQQEKSAESARANAAGALVASVKKVIAMTGTLIGGKASHVRSLLFRLAAKSLRSEDLTWKDELEFARRYGRLDTIVVEKSGPAYDNRRSSGKTTKRQTEQPGVMPTLYARHLVSNTVFLSLADVAANLPSYEEIPTPVSMSAELEAPYRIVEAKLKDAVKELLRKGSHQLLSAMLHALLAYPDYPFDWRPITYVDKKDGPHGRTVLVTTPPTLDRTKLWPKERKLLEILTAEKAQGRQSLLFATYTGVHPMLERLESVVTRAGFRAKVLHADRVPTRNRGAWIAAHAPGVDLMICHPAVVETGLTLLDTKGSFNFATTIFAQTGYSTFTLRQASRRGYRIGQKHPCKVYLMFYQQTMQERAMKLMSQKIQASLALEGQFSADGLAAMADDGGSLTMELAKSLVENLPFTETERVWAKFGADACEQMIKSAGTVVPQYRPRQLDLLA